MIVSWAFVVGFFGGLILLSWLAIKVSRLARDNWVIMTTLKEIALKAGLKEPLEELTRALQANAEAIGISSETGGGGQ